MRVLGLRIVVPSVLQRSDRGHHVPALTVTSGGRDVGTDVAFSDKSSRRENGTESGGVDAQIPVTERETHRVTKFVSTLDLQSLLSAVRAACWWLLLWVLAWTLLGSVSVSLVLFLFSGVQPRKEHGHRPKNRQ